MEQQTIIFLGPQGSGKGTQLKLLQDFLKGTGDKEVLALDVGASLREFSSQKGYTQEKILASMNRGELQPGFISGYLASKFFIEHLHHDAHLLLDGFPRNEENWFTLESTMRFYERVNPALLYINISDEEAVKRLLLRGRADDTEESIRKRLAWSRDVAAPIIEKFRASPDFRFFEINGERSIEEIHKNIIEVLGLEAKV